MKDQLSSLIEEHTKEVSIPAEKTGTVHNEILSSIQGGISSAISKGDIGNVMNLFSDGANDKNVTSNPLFGSISNNLLGGLEKKSGLSKGDSESIVSKVLPTILGQFSKKVGDSSDKSIDMNSVIKSISGGKSGAGIDFNDILGQFMKGNGGGIDLGSIAGSLISGGGKSKGGGILKMLSGLFGKK
jgi:hypothetical protein